MIADVIHKIAEQEQAAQGRTGFSAYRVRPSNMGPERCIRQLVYHAEGMPPTPLPGRSLLTMDDSKWHEELTLMWLEKHAVLKPHSRQKSATLRGVLTWMPHKRRQCSAKIDGKPCADDIYEDDVHGHIDCEVTDLAQVVWVVEHKAISHHSFARCWEGDELPMDYLTQTAIYIRALGLTAGLLLIKNKNTAQYMEFQLQYDPATDILTVTKAIRSHFDMDDVNQYDVNFSMENVTNSAIEKARLVWEYKQKKVRPARPFAFGTTFPCGYCAWEGSCWAGYEEEIKAMGPGTIQDQAFYDLCTKERQLQEIQAEHEARAKVLAEERKELKLEIRNQMMDQNLNTATVVVPARDGAPPLPAYNVAIKMVHKKAQGPTEYEQTTVKAIAAGKKEDPKKSRREPQNGTANQAA